MGLFNIPFVARTRRNHALEHATIHLLNQRYPTLRLVGWSTPAGFYVYGHIPTVEIRQAVNDALTRLRSGESHLAIHPRCGTNLVTAGALVGLTAFLAMLPGDHPSRRSRLPLIVLLSTLALMLSQPLGLVVQERITTDAHLGQTLGVVIERGMAGDTPLHKIRTDYGS
jgi:hypothetical protein